MLKSLALACALLCALTINADARPRASIGCTETGTVMHPVCVNNDFLAGVRSINVTMTRDHPAREARPSSRRGVKARHGFVVSHPSGCPARAFCGCGASVRVFGRPVRDLWLASNWFRFPRTSPASGMVAVRRHHVFVLEAHLGGNTWQVFDANSGGHRTRIHARSIAGYAIVNPRGRAA